MPPTWDIPPLASRFSERGQPPFVGRRAEMDRLEQIWEAVDRGERQAVFLGGEPGSGKTRLAAEMARALHRDGAVVLLGSTSRDLSYPYEPLVEALNDLLTGTEPGSLAENIPDSAVELTRLTPHLRRHRTDLPERSPATEEYRRELFSAYVDLFQSLTSDRPTALFLEDLHWASAPTRLFVTYLIENITDAPLLVFGTMRTTTPDRSEDLSFAIADLHRHPGVTRIDLPALTVDEVEEYLMLQLGGERAPALREAAVLLRDQTGGNPFFLRETWRELADQGGVSALRRRETVAAQSVRDTLRRRIQAFDGSGRTILEYAAVLGQSFEASDIIHAVDVQPDDVLRALDQGSDSGLLTHAEGGDEWSFRHALVRQTLLDDLASSRSAEIHAGLAESIERRYSDDPGLAPLLARLFAGARPLGYRDRTIFYLSEAAMAARRSLAHEEAAELFEEAAKTVRGDQPSRENLLLSAARSRLLAGDFPEARTMFEEVNRSEDPRQALQAAIGFEDASWRPGNLGDEAKAMLEWSLDRIPADPTDTLYVAGRVSLARAHTFSGNAESAERIGREALEMARATGDRDLLADALVATLLRVISVSHFDPDTYELSLELRELAMKSGNYDALGPAGSIKGLTGFLTADRPVFDEGWQDLSLAAAKTGQPFWEWVDGCYRYCQEFISGQFDRAQETAIRINQLGDAFSTDEADGPFGIQMYMVQRETGQLGQVREMITGNPIHDGSWGPGLLSLYTEMQMAEPARAVLASSIDLARTMSTRDAIYPGVLAFLVEGALYLEEEDALRRLRDIVSGFDGYNLVAGQCVAAFGSANSYLGRIEMAFGDHEEAERNFRKALDMDVAIGSIVHQAETLAHLANLLDLVGESDRAVDCRSRSRLLADPIGHQRVLRLLEARTESHPDGLSPREIEVLELLAIGASNKEIGEKLFISPNTAANHVRSILMKTGLPNRTAAAAYAAERGLV